MWTQCTLAMGSCRSEQTSPRPARMLGSGSLGQAQRWSARWETRWRPGPSPLLQVCARQAMGAVQLSKRAHPGKGLVAFGRDSSL